MRPDIGKCYLIRIPRPRGYEYLGDETTVRECISHIIHDRWEFAIPLPHAGDEGRGVGLAVSEIDILEEAE